MANLNSYKNILTTIKNNGCNFYAVNQSKYYPGKTEEEYDVVQKKRLNII